MNLVFNTRTLVNTLIISLLTIILSNCVVIALRFSMHYESEFFDKVFRKLYVDTELNLPTFYNALLLLGATALLFIIFLMSRDEPSVRSKWLSLALIFLFLSVDEVASLHEFLIHLVPRYTGLGGSGFLMFAWVIPYGAAFVLIVLYYLQFVLRLQRKIAVGFIFSAIVYVTGALGFEMIGSEIASTSGVQNLYYAGMATVEEGMEMTGLIMFIHYLFEYIKTKSASVKVTFD